MTSGGVNYSADRAVRPTKCDRRVVRWTGRRFIVRGGYIVATTSSPRKVSTIAAQPSPIRE
jgi:hypothetical protein